LDTQPAALAALAGKGLLALLILIFLVPIYCWTVLLLFGMGPKRVWREIVEWRSLALQLDDPMTPIPKVALPIYVTLGPLILVSNIFVGLGALIAAIFIVLACPPGGAVVLVLPAVVLHHIRHLRHASPDISFWGIYTVLVIPLVFAAAGAAFASNLLINETGYGGIANIDFDRLEDQIGGAMMVSTGVGLAIIGGAYTTAALCWPAALLTRSASFSRLVTQWPGLLLIWLERKTHVFEKRPA
jgi:hypothetical protein